MRYASTRDANGRTVYVHRVVWEEANGPIPDGYYVDHINHIRTDNRVENLRLATPSESACNVRTGTRNTSGFKGISRKTLHGKPYWRVQIKCAGVTIDRCFRDLQDAVEFNQDQREVLHGAFTCHG